MLKVVARRLLLPVALRSGIASKHSSSVVDAASRGVRGYEEILEHNWARNVHFGAMSVQVPESVAELKAVVKDAASPCRVVGRGHSFSPMAECADGTLLSLARLNGVLNFQAPTKHSIGSITVEGGATYTEVIRFLDGRGALRNLPSCPQFTVSGAIATGTHGSGVHAKSLACDVSMVEFIVADGSTVQYSRE